MLIPKQRRESLDLNKKLQKKICRKYGEIFCEALRGDIVGVSKSLKGPHEPVHGLRHPLSKDTTGWYIWAGEYSSNVDFFQPIHLEHLYEIRPEIIKFLGLPPGWRFLKAGHYEDVWFDVKLLSI